MPASTIALLEKLEAGNPGNKRIHVIADNARDHHACLVRHWLPHQVRLLPAHAPHPGAIKRLWGDTGASCAGSRE